MTFLISFLVVEKVRVALNRYMAMREALGTIFMSMRLLNQLVILYTEAAEKKYKPKENKQWELSVQSKIEDVLNITVNIVKDQNKMVRLAYGDGNGNENTMIYDCMDLGCLGQITELDPKNVDINQHDPMIRIQALRLHLYTNFGLGSYGDNPLEMLEKMRILEICRQFTIAFTELLKYRTTPIPFPLLQMGRTILLVYTFSMPLALIGFVPDFSLPTVMLFIFFLTYGYVGLELVAFRLLTPFGNKACDFNIEGMRKATRFGIESDWIIYHQGNRIKNEPNERSPKVIYNNYKPFDLSSYLQHTE